MPTDPLLQSATVQTSRLRMHYLSAGPEDAPTIILIHGNVSSSLFWEETMRTLCKRFRVLAPDLRGYGDTEALPIDATRGMRDWSDDLDSFTQALGLTQPVHYVGWSLGAGVVMQSAIDHPTAAASLTLISPMSPFGFGGTKTPDGTPNYADFAGSGGGTVNAIYVERIRSGDRGADDANSPRNVMNQFYFRPPFRVAEAVEEQFVDSMLTTRTGSDFYPGSFTESPNWPGVAPGPDGVANAMSPKYVNLSDLVSMSPKCPILWIRGDSDTIVSDASLLDFGTLGQMGLVPGWPGETVYPSQPMVAQMRYVLEQYREQGGRYEEFVVREAGHSPHIEHPAFVLNHMESFFTTS